MCLFLCLFWWYISKLTWTTNSLSIVSSALAALLLYSFFLACLLSNRYITGLFVNACLAVSSLLLAVSSLLETVSTGVEAVLDGVLLSLEKNPITRVTELTMGTFVRGRAADGPGLNQRSARLSRCQNEYGKSQESRADLLGM